MSVSSDRFEMLNRLRSSNDREAVVAATNMLKLLSSAIVAQNSRSNTLVVDYLEGSVQCLTRFPSDEEINENIICAVCSLATSKKDYTQSIYSSGLISPIISTIKTFPRNQNLSVAAIRILQELCTVEKRASIIIRVQGGLVSAIELLMQPCYESDPKITRYIFEFLTSMARKSAASAAVVAKNRGIAFIMLAARRHLFNARVFQSTLALLDRLCAVKATVNKIAETQGMVQLIFDALGHYRYVPRSFTSLMQILKCMAGTRAGCQAIHDAGGFDAILALIEHNLVKPATVRLASLLLWHLQHHNFAAIASDEKSYNLQSNHFRVNFPEGEISQFNDDDGYASDDSCSDRDVDDDDEASPDISCPKPQVPVDSTRANSENSWRKEQFMPELWPSNDPDTEDFFKRSAQEIELYSKPRSVRALMHHPDCLIMERSDGTPGNENLNVEPQYAPMQSQVLATMHASSDRFRTSQRFQHRIIYDRCSHDGFVCDLPAYSTKPKTVYGAAQSDYDCDYPDVAYNQSFHNFVVDTHRKTESFPGQPYRIPPLSFESRFESGNLFRAIMVGETEYDLILSSDINTSGRTQWFLFRVENMKTEIPYKFNIINLEKPDSAFNRGMRPVFYSKLAAESGQSKWCRSQTATNIGYFQNYFRKPNPAVSKKSKSKSCDSDETDYYHTLTFTMAFPYTDDTVYLAYFYPFTFTYQQHCLLFLESRTKNAEFFRRQTLCYSLGGNAVDLLTVTNFKSTAARIQQRPAIVLSARIHPGESNSSWVMKGVLELLTGDSDVAHFLRDNAVFKIIPMLNPDGVIEGNYRCSLAGHDQNRQWAYPNENLSPVVFNVRKLIMSIAKDRQLLMFCDFHGHSVASNFMIYGNDEMECSALLKAVNTPLVKDEKIKKPLWLSTVGEEFPNKERIFPAMLARRAYNLFSMEQCNFAVQKTRAGTARVSKLVN